MTLLPSLRSPLWSLSLLGLGAAACTEPDPAPPVVPPAPSALARCADPAVALAERWRVDNLHDPITTIARTGSTIVVASADGALKTWHVAADAATETRPTYGTPIVDQGTALGALAAGPAIASIDVDGRARLWSTDGAAMGDPMALLPGAGAVVAIDADLRWLAGATAAYGGDLTVADLATGAMRGPLPTQLWHAAAAQIGATGWVTVGDWYSCVGIELRDPADPDTAIGYWDGCNGAVETLYQGWFRAVALDPTAATAIAVGDQHLATFALADLAAGPTAIAPTPVRLDRVARLDGDQLAITLATTGDTSELTWWSLVDLTARRTVTIPAAVDLTVDAEAGLIVAASSDGLLRGYACE